MPWNAKLDWAEEVYTMLIVLPVPVIAVGILWYIAPLLHRRRIRAGQQAAQDVAAISENTVGERT